MSHQTHLYDRSCSRAVGDVGSWSTQTGGQPPSDVRLLAAKHRACSQTDNCRLPSFDLLLLLLLLRDDIRLLNVQARPGVDMYA